MNVNKYRFTLNPNTQQITIPIDLSWENAGRGEAVSAYESDIIAQVINPIDDFEVTRFAHSFWNIENTKTNISYEFFFFDSQDNQVTATTDCSLWLSDYESAGFTDDEIYYFSNSFKNSFFKLDFYDNKQTETQRLYFTVILPTQQGLVEPGFIGSVDNPTEVLVKYPTYVLDYVGDKEGFFLYWLKDTSYLDIDTFYFTVKFFNAKTGQFVRMMNQCQGQLPNKFNFNQADKFYYKCELDYSNYEYKMYSEALGGSTTRVGTETNPIKWYEYINP